MIDSIARQVNADAGLVHRGRFVTTAFVIVIDNTYYQIRVEHGRVVKIVAGPFLGADHSFVLRAPRDVWEKFWLPLPPPGFNDIFALTKQKMMRLEGNVQPFMTNLLYFKDVIGAPRRGAAP
jgi:hypothetical protein